MEDLTVHAPIDTERLAQLEQQELCLIPLLGNGASGMRVISRPETVLGRQSGVDVVVRDPKVSRRHCKIVLTESGPRILDLRSRNGTFVNDKPLAEGALKDGDLIRVGDSVFRMRYVNKAERQREEEMYRQATRDFLTGLYTRQYLLERLDQELARARRHHFSLSFLVLDVDDFKKVNDRLGHPAGDSALSALAEVLRDNIRGEDVVARVGGEEFAVLALLADVEGARSMGERLRRLIEENSWSREDGGMPLTVSVGSASFPDDADTAADLMHKADVALYKAKHAGRNRTVTYSDGSETQKR